MINKNGMFTVRKWKLILGVVLSAMVIVAQAFILLTDRFKVLSAVENNGESIRELKQIVDTHVNLPSHLYSGFQLQQIQKDLGEIKADVKEIKEMKKRN